LRAMSLIRNLSSLVFVFTILSYAFNVAAEPFEDKVREFVRSIHHHGIPYEEARDLGTQAVPVLVEMLDDVTEETSWANIVFCLGAIGDRSAIGPLEDFYRSRFDRKVSPAAFKALVQVPRSLGILARSKDQPHFKRLVANLSDERQPKWTFDTFGPEDRNLFWLGITIDGLSFSSLPEARSALLKLDEEYASRALVSKKSKEDAEQLSDLLLEAVATQSIVARFGPEVIFSERSETLLAKEREKYKKLLSTGGLALDLDK